MPMWPPIEQSFMVPVAGDLAATDSLPEHGIGVAVIGPVVKYRLFSGPSGSIPGFMSSYM